VDIKYTYDERVEDGLACALALAGLKELIEDPRRFEEGVTDYEGRAPIGARL
jgi:pyruvate/2-oxoglutarate dehydrogenase complex dihydrolipoamide acyltransferase (E2) component